MENIIQETVDFILPLLPKKWEKFIFYAEYCMNSYSMKFFVNTKRKQYLDCYHLPNVNHEKIDFIFPKIHSVLNPIWNKLSGKNKWTVMTISVDHDGNCTVEYDYSDHSKSLIGWEEDWKKKYLL